MPIHHLRVPSGNDLLDTILHEPENPRAWVVTLHGLEANKDGRKYLELAELLTPLGIGLARFDFRGCGLSTGSFGDTNVASRIEDGLRVIEALKGRPGAERLGLYGSSMGGYVWWHGTRTPKRLPAFSAGPASASFAAPGAAGRPRDRGGAEAAHGAVASLREGFSVAMTADVPPGPARKCGMGIVMIASLSGRPIVPFAVATSRYRAINSWSRMTINLPFSRLGIVMGDPIYVPEGAGREELEVYRKRVEAALNETTAKAYAVAGADPARATPPPYERKSS